MAFNLRGFVSGHKVLVGVALLIALLTGWWKYEFPSGTWRYKMTVTVETPEGLKTGYAVREVRFREFPQILGATSGTSVSTRGEAVVVDLGHEKYLFALMDVDGSYRIVYDAFPHQSENVHEYIHYYKSLTGQKKVLEHNQYPTFVTFTDIKDPKSVVAVARDNLAGPFGAGVTLKDITLEMTDEEVTWGIETYLGWLDTVKGGYLDGGFTMRNSPLGLHGGNFKNGEQK
jgi:hypothetical protein